MSLLIMRTSFALVVIREREASVARRFSHQSFVCPYLSAHLFRFCERERPPCSSLSLFCIRSVGKSTQTAAASHGPAAAAGENAAGAAGTDPLSPLRRGFPGARRI